MKKGFIITGILISGFLILSFFAPIFGWSKINSQYQSINIKTGKARYTYYFWYVKYSEEVKPTSLSRALQGKKVDVSDTGEWKTVNVFSPPSSYVSPHFAYHGALAQAERFKWISKRCSLSKKEKRNAAGKILRIWQRSGHYFDVDDYIEQLENECQNE